MSTYIHLPQFPMNGTELEHRAAASTVAPVEQSEWCEPCRSYHPKPRDMEHAMELRCVAGTAAAAPSAAAQDEAALPWVNYVGVARQIADFYNDKHPDAAIAELHKLVEYVATAVRRGAITPAPTTEEGAG